METEKVVNKGFNTLCEEYKNSLVQIVNQSNLPIGVVYYITKNIMTEIEHTYYGVLNEESVEHLEERNGN